MKQGSLVRELASNLKSISNCKDKTTFHDRAAARRFKRENNLKQKPYFCVHCHRWHLTTKKATDV